MINFNLEKTPPVFIVSDLHLTHKNIIKYCDRKYPLTDEATAQMKEDLLSEFDKLPTTCTIINNGDVLDTKDTHTIKEVKAITDRMKGPKGLRKLVLILGNHDNCKYHGDRVQFYLRAGFDAVYASPIIVDDRFILSHEPVYLNPGNNLINLYGHTHNEDICSKSHIGNAGYSDYFMYDYDNWCMIAKVCRKDGLPEPPLSDYLKYPWKGVLPQNYKNVCWDANYKILDYKALVNELNANYSEVNNENS